MRLDLFRRIWLVFGIASLVFVIPPARAVHDAGSKPPPDTPALHEHSPAPFAEVFAGLCSIAGTIDIDDSTGTGGIDALGQLSGAKNHNHYSFSSTWVQCAGGPIPGRLDVFAAGGTDGQGDCDATFPDKSPKCLIGHGESGTNGWSHKNGYAGDMPPTLSKKKLDDIYSGTNENPIGSGQCTNCNEIWVQNDGPDGVKGTIDDRLSCQNISKLEIMVNVSDAKPCANDLKFCRGTYNDGLKDDEIPDLPGDEPWPTCSNVFNGGTLTSRDSTDVLVWGHLVNWSHDKALVVCFAGDLELVPLMPNHDDSLGKVTKAFLVGTAFTWSVLDKADCLDKKNVKPE